MEGVAIDVQTEGTNAVATETGEGCNPDLNYCCNKVAGARLMSENCFVLHAIILLQGYTLYPHHACSRFVAFDNQLEKRYFTTCCQGRFTHNQKVTFRKYKQRRRHNRETKITNKILKRNETQQTGSFSITTVNLVNKQVKNSFVIGKFRDNNDIGLIH